MHRFSQGERFCLVTEALAIEMREGRTCALTIPAKSTVKIAALPYAHDDRMAEVTWGEPTALIFGMDLIHRARKVKAADA